MAKCTIRRWCTVREAEQHLRGIEPYPSFLLSHILQPPSHYGVGCSYLSHAPGYDLILYYRHRNSEATLIWPETKHIAPKLTFSGPKINSDAADGQGYQLLTRHSGDLCLASQAHITNTITVQAHLSCSSPVWGRNCSP